MFGSLLLGAALAALGAGFVDAPAPPSSPATDRAAYEQARKNAGRDANAHVKLALWCEAHDLGPERLKHLALAVLYDPSNGLARGLLGLVSYQGKWKRPEQISQQVRDDPARKRLMAEYLERRAKTPDRAEDQWRLALWCEQNGLKDQAVAQYHAVLRRDPKREVVWKRLGFKKVKGRWTKPEWEAARKREQTEQEHANKRWKPQFERLWSGLSSRDQSRRESADEELSRIIDPRAVPMLWAVFVPKKERGQELAVRTLAQIDAPGASRALALLALSGKSDAVRSQAAQVLKHRDPRDFAPLLVGMIRDPIKYEVKDVRGPGQTGELTIKGQGTRPNVKRMYSPPPLPRYMMTPLDSVSLDANGLPVIMRFLGAVSSPSTVQEFPLGISRSLLLSQLANNYNATPFSATAMLTNAGVPAGAVRGFDAMFNQQVKSNLSHQVNSAMQAKANFQARNPNVPQSYVAGDFVATTNAYRPIEIETPIGEMTRETWRAAKVAEMQLVGDARKIDAYNAPVLKVNRLARRILSETVGVDKGDDRAAWAKWMVDLFGYAYSPQKSSTSESTIFEQVPLAYRPQVGPALSVGALSQSTKVSFIPPHHACFAAGTPVQTINGPRPIEYLLAGDDVLTQNSTTGKLSYQPIVEVYHNPPNETFEIALEGQGPKTDSSVVATGIHRLWKAGKGWTMVRDLRPGDVLRTLGGTARIESIQPERVQPVFNLKVAEGESYFVGGASVLAHDNSPVETVPDPFDAVAPMNFSARAGQNTSHR